MSRYAVLPEDGVGPGGVIVFRRGRIERTWALHVGSELFGMIFQWPGGDWEGQSTGPHPRNDFFGEINRLRGFATRFDAATFIIKHHGYWLREEREQRATRLRFEARIAELTGDRERKR